MATNVVDINQVPPDVDEMEVGTVKNPLTEEFIHPYAGKEQVIPAGKEEKAFRFVKVEEKDEKTGKIIEKKKKEEYMKVIPGEKQFPLYVALHLANHLAKKIITTEFKKRISEIKDEKKREIEAGKPIPDFKGKVWDKMKELVETDSKFFDEKDVYGESRKENFVK